MQQQSKRTCVLSTQGFGCTHGLIEGSSSEGVPEECGQSCCLQGTESRRHYQPSMSAYLLPFPSSSHSSSPFERITGLSSYCICGQTLLPHRLHLWVPLCWLAVYLLLCCGSLSCLQAPFAMWSNLPTFQQRMNMLGILVYCAVSFPFPLDSPSCGCRISCKSEERQKERLKPP